MKILWTFCIYNEIELLPFKMNYIRKNGIVPYVFDNMSTDGSWEWLCSHKIPSERFASGEMFDLTVNTKLLSRKIHEAKPDWVIMAGTDIFYVHLKNTLREVIELADKAGFNCVHDCYSSFQFMFTGEEKPGKDPRLTYMYYDLKILGAICMAKYSRGLRFKSADYLAVPNQTPYRDVDFAMLHYSIRHDAEDRKTEQYARRKKAWEAGRTARCYGAHYERIIKAKAFVFDKRVLRDVRQSRFWEPIRKSVEA